VATDTTITGWADGDKGDANSLVDADGDTDVVAVHESLLRTRSE
jgi:hypothetical protein